jgi:hypothetical protein
MRITIEPDKIYAVKMNKIEYPEPIESFWDKVIKKFKLLIKK